MGVKSFSFEMACARASTLSSVSTISGFVAADYKVLIDELQHVAFAPVPSCKRAEV